MEFVMPAFACVIVVFGLIKRVPVFDIFLKGAKEGMQILYSIAPTIIGLVFAVARYPDVVVSLQVGSVGEVAVDEHLADVEHGARAGVALYGLHPHSHGAEHGLWSAHLRHLFVRRFEVEHGRHVPAVEPRVAQKVGCLCRSRGLCGEEVVGSDVYSTPTRSGIVGCIVAVAYGATLCLLYVHERNGVVYLAVYGLFADGSEVGDAQTVPVYGVVSAPHVVLEA